MQYKHFSLDIKLLQQLLPNTKTSAKTDFCSKQNFVEELAKKPIF